MKCSILDIFSMYILTSMVKGKKTHKNRKTKNRKTFKKNVCNPSISRQMRPSSKFNTCLNDTILTKVKNIYNMRHPDEKITSKSSKDIHKGLKSKLQDVCSSERCWIESIVPDGVVK